MASDRAKLKKLADLIKDHVGNEALTTSYLRKNAVDALNILEGENKEVIVDLDRQLNSAIEIIFDHQVTEEQLQGKLKESEKKLEKEEKKSKKFEILFEKVGSRLSLKRKVAKEYKETAENNGLPVEEYEEKLENDEQKKRQLKSFVASRLAVFKQEIEDEIDNS